MKSRAVESTHEQGLKRELEDKPVTAEAVVAPRQAGAEEDARVNEVVVGRAHLLRHARGQLHRAEPSVRGKKGWKQGDGGARGEVGLQSLYLRLPKLNLKTQVLKLNTQRGNPYGKAR